MQKFIYLVIFLFVFEAAAIAQSRDGIKVAAAVAALNEAMIRADKNALENLTAAQLSYGHSVGKVENKTQFITSLTSGVVDFSSIDISGQTVQLAGKNAIVRNIFNARLTNDGKPVELKIGNIMVWKKMNGKWKLLARQGYKI